MSCIVIFTSENPHQLVSQLEKNNSEELFIYSESESKSNRIVKFVLIPSPNDNVVIIKYKNTIVISEHSDYILIIKHKKYNFKMNNSK